MTLIEFEKYIGEKIMLFVYGDDYPCIDKVVSKKFVISYLIKYMSDEFIFNNKQSIERIAMKASMSLFYSLLQNRCGLTINSNTITKSFVNLFK